MNEFDATCPVTAASHNTRLRVVAGRGGDTVVELPGSMTDLSNDAYRVLVRLHMIGWHIRTDWARHILDGTVRVVAGQPGPNTWWWEASLTVPTGQLSVGRLYQPRTARGSRFDSGEEFDRLLHSHHHESHRWIARATRDQGVRPQYCAAPGDLVGLPATHRTIVLAVDHNLGDGHLVAHAVQPADDEYVHAHGTPYDQYQLQDGQIVPTTRRRNQHRSVVLAARDTTWIAADGVAI